MLWWISTKVESIDVTWEPSFVDEIKGHLRSSCKIGWKCENGLIWKVGSPNWNQTWFIDIIWGPSYVNAVKGHILRSKVIWGQVVRYAENVKMASFEKLKSDWNQTWFIDIIWGPSYVLTVKGHIPRSKVIWGQVVRQAENGLIWKVEVQFEPHLVYWYDMGIFICSCGQKVRNQVQRSTCKITWKCKFGLICIWGPTRITLTG